MRWWEVLIGAGIGPLLLIVLTAVFAAVDEWRERRRRRRLTPDPCPLKPGTP